MEKLIIHGGNRLEGHVKISGAKNAVLPIIAATLLGQETASVLDEVPALEDVHTITDVLRKLGVRVSFDQENHRLTVDSTRIECCEAPYDLVRKMRASFLIMGVRHRHASHRSASEGLRGPGGGYPHRPRLYRGVGSRGPQRGASLSGFPQRGGYGEHPHGGFHGKGADGFGESRPGAGNR